MCYVYVRVCSVGGVRESVWCGVECDVCASVLECLLECVVCAVYVECITYARKHIHPLHIHMCTHADLLLWVEDLEAEALLCACVRVFMVCTSV